MTRLRGIALGFVPLIALSSANAQSRGHSGPERSGWTSHHVGPGHKSHGPGLSPVTINPGCRPIGSYPTIIGYTPIYYGWSPYLLTPPMMATGPVMPPLTFGDPTVFIPPVMVATRTANPTPRPMGRNVNRSKELMTLGDRLFRAGNYVRAVDRYEQAIRADPDLAEPRARLAQVALVRGKYGEAANKFREAQAAEPGWLATAGNAQDLYPEPADFARHVARLEAHLQAHVDDRDGWLVLGALWYLSGRTQKAADVFLRLSDRKEDPTLRAFLAATKTGE
ncbi:MAG: hypothetical protein JWN86_4232 [Planctomycetota bacterium]|nr:hypothetical protein [Planctomycetota bacterium]